MSDLKFKD